MHRPELSPFDEFRGLSPEVRQREARWLANARYVGWLSPAVDFPVGDLDPRVFDWLIANVETLHFNQARGFHTCEFCGRQPTFYLDGDRWRLGSAELLIRTVEDRAYVAPDLLPHYIRDHGYQPPAEFVADLLAVARVAG